MTILWQAHAFKFVRNNSQNEACIMDDIEVKIWRKSLYQALKRCFWIFIIFWYKQLRSCEWWINSPSKWCQHILVKRINFDKDFNGFYIIVVGNTAYCIPGPDYVLVRGREGEGCKIHQNIDRLHCKTGKTFFNGSQKKTKQHRHIYIFLGFK